MTNSTHQPKPAVLWMLWASLCFAAMGTLVKLGMAEASSWQAVFFRSLFGLLPILIISHFAHISLVGKRRKLLLVRSLTGFIALCFAFYSLGKLTLGNSTILITTSPIFLALISYPFLKERVSPRVFALLPLFVLGIGFVVKPDPSFSLFPSFAALTAAFFIAVTQLQIRVLGQVNHSVTIVFYFMGFSVLGSAIPAYLFWNPIGWDTLFLLIGAGLVGTVAQLSMTRSLQLGRASFVGLFNYAIPVFAFFADVIFFAVIPDLSAIMGASLVILCGIAALYWTNGGSKSKKS